MGIFMLFNNLLPEASCCCLQTCNVYGTWVTLYCICGKKFHGHLCLHQLVIGTFSLFRYILPEAICCCLQTCNVYGTWVTLYCICVQILMVTCANIS